MNSETEDGYAEACPSLNWQQILVRLVDTGLIQLMTIFLDFSLGVGFSAVGSKIRITDRARLNGWRGHNVSLSLTADEPQVTIQSTSILGLD